MPRISSLRSPLYRTPTRIGAGVRFAARGTRLGTGRSPLILRSGRAVGMYNPYVRAGLITAAGLAAARAGLKKARRSRLYGRIGKPVGTATSKSRAIVNTTNGRSTRTLYSSELTNIPKGTTNQRNERDRHLVNLRGFKLCFSLRNNLAIPLVYNIAVVYDKRSNDDTASVSVNDFFRGSGANRAVDFSTGLSALQLHCKPLNKDRFTILWHHRGQLAPRQDGTNFNSTYPNIKQLHKWIGLRKQVSYEDGHAQSKIWLIYWCDQFQDEASDAAIVGALTFQEYHITYFREPKT